MLEVTSEIAWNSTLRSNIIRLGRVKFRHHLDTVYVGEEGEDPSPEEAEELRQEGELHPL